MGLPRSLASSSDFQTTTACCYDDRSRTLTDGDWRDRNDSDASEESDEVHSTVPMKLQLNRCSVCMFFEAADASVCIRKMSLIVHANEIARWDYVHPKITKFRFCLCSILGIVKPLLLYKNIVPKSPI